eukprot:CAMPEP_0115838240 /NCGR_PEP_ID=MMETSP0287-20121206/5627_1 /TAXON_ID=412157 /ORGANISM="Chrysochromulina rotalis, Strain UIO044" /LENGTH=308 /DNA_ID=CAMNT_0003291761 /DNA_START=148 /DNA_END=1071 /DNA_ORIENTATION=+
MATYPPSRIARLESLQMTEAGAAHVGHDPRHEDRRRERRARREGDDDKGCERDGSRHKGRGDGRHEAGDEDELRSAGDEDAGGHARTDAEEDPWEDLAADEPKAERDGRRKYFEAEDAKDEAHVVIPDALTHDPLHGLGAVSEGEWLHIRYRSQQRATNGWGEHCPQHAARQSIEPVAQCVARLLEDGADDEPYGAKQTAHDADQRGDCELVGIRTLRTQIVHGHRKRRVFQQCKTLRSRVHQPRDGGTNARDDSELHIALGKERGTALMSMSSTMRATLNDGAGSSVPIAAAIPMATSSFFSRAVAP